MTKSPEAEMAQRINRALDLLRESSSTEEVVAALKDQYQISRRQAYRYIYEAQRQTKKLAVPEQKVVFTVKLPISLAARLRKLARSAGESLSALVTQALEAFLKRGRHG